MLDQLRKALLAGMGVVFYTREKVEDVVKDLIHGGHLTREQGAKILEELVKRGEEGTGELGAKINDDLRGLLGKIGPVSRAEFETYRSRLEAVERRLGLAVPEAPPSADE